MRQVLLPFELLYRGVNRVRRALYRWQILRARRLPRPVISIGNIAMGGTGKTPAVIAVCRFLESRGLRVAVLTRGYRKKEGSSGGVVSALDAENYGDEPVLIKSRINGDVIVSRYRYDIARQYLSDHDCDVFVLDDGFQHLQLHRDLDVVIDAPSRFFREGRAALRRADIVIPRRMRLALPENLTGRPLFAFAALADNEQFFDSLRASGAQLAGTKGFPDHHFYSTADLAALRNAAGDAPLVTTEKDAVKLPEGIATAVPAEFEIDAAVLERIAAVAARGERRRAKRRKHPLLQHVEYLLYRGVSHAALRMPERALLSWGTRIGNLARRLVRRRDRLALRNLARAFPDRSAAERRAILDECWRHFGRELMQVLRTRSLSLEEVGDRCPIENAHLVDEALARGKGVLLLSAHWGGWEIAGLAIMGRFRKIRTVARPLDNALLERDLQRLREKTGAEVVDRRKAARVLLRGLSENGVIVLLPDQAVQPREGVLVPFLDMPAWTTDAPAKLALRAGATIVFGFCIPDGLRHRLILEEPIRADLLEGTDRDPVQLTRRINEVIGRHIRERPELWLWMHDRWKGTAESDVGG